MSQTHVTIVGNLAADPVLRFTANGQAVANFTVAASERFLDKVTNEWREEEAIFMRCAVWRDVAHNLADSLRRGDRVMVTGKLRSRSWEDADTGDKRYSTELDVTEVGASLRFALVKPVKAVREGAQASDAGSARVLQPA